MLPGPPACRSTRTTPTARATPTAPTRTTSSTGRRRSRDIVRDLTPFFVSRQVFTGAGKVGAEAPWDERGRPIYQLTQRADFFETEVGLETTLKRPIINTRDEPHADPEKYRRLHVIIGDANMCEVAHVPEGRDHRDRAEDDRGRVPARPLARRTRCAPCTRSRGTSRARRTVPLADGRRLTAVQLQWEYLEHAKKYVEREDDTPRSTRGRSSGGRPCSPRWRPTRCRCTASSTGWRSTACSRPTGSATASTWAIPKLHAIDLQYHDVRREKGLYYRLERAGKVERLVDGRRGRARRDGAARGHPRLLPRPLHRAVPATRSRPHRGTR